MILFTKCLVFAFWVYIRLPIGIYASEAPIKESESSHTCLIAIMEDIEQVKTTPIREISNFKSEPAQEKPTQENYFSRLPVEVIRHILDMVLLYKDQLSFMLCASGYKDYAKFITRTHIRNLNRKKESTDQSYYLNLLSDLKYLWITSCDISDIVFNTEKLTGLAIRWSNVNPTLLLKQQSLSYLDVRTPSNNINKDTLQTVLRKNSSLLVLRVNVSNGGGVENSYQNLPYLRSIEFVDINNSLVHIEHLSALRYLQEIILSSFEVGRLEAYYKEALITIDQKISLNGLTVILKCINESERWKMPYTKTELKSLIESYLL